MPRHNRQTRTLPQLPKPLTKAVVEDRIAQGAARRMADHVNGGHASRPVLGCILCG